MISQEHGEYLLNIAKKAVKTYLETGEQILVPEDCPEELKEKLGVFVTLNKNIMIDIVKEYAAKRLDLLKMEATEKSSVTAGTFTFLAIVAVAAVFFLILLNIGLGLLIGSYLGNYAYGLLIMAGIYLLIIIIVFLARNSIKNAVANKIIHSLNS